MGKFGPDHQNCWFKLKFGIYFCKFEYPEFCGVHFFSFKPKIPFLGKFGPKRKQNYLFKLKFVRLIGVYRIQWWWSLFLFPTKNTIFGKFGPQNQNTSLS